MDLASHDLRMQFLQQRFATLQEMNLVKRRENLKLRIQSAQFMLRVRQAIAVRNKMVAPVA
jgi:hypothetical protein